MFITYEFDLGISSVSLLKDPNGLVIFMTRNLSFDEQVSKELVFNTSVQRKSLFNLLFHNPNISHIFPVDVNQTPSKTSQNNNVSISETLLQNMNLKMEEGLLYTYLRQHDISQEILSLLLGNNSDYLQELSNFIRVNSILFSFHRKFSISLYLILITDSYACHRMFYLMNLPCPSKYASLGKTKTCT